MVHYNHLYDDNDDENNNYDNDYDDKVMVNFYFFWSTVYTLKGLLL